MTSQGKEQGNRIIRKSGMGSSVFMMEMIMVVFFFCLCAAVSSLLFARADSMSRLAADTNQAVLKAENLAEIFKSGGMDHYQDYPETAGGLAFDTGMGAAGGGRGWRRLPLLRGNGDLKGRRAWRIYGNSGHHYNQEPGWEDAL